MLIVSTARFHVPSMIPEAAVELSCQVLCATWFSVEAMQPSDVVPLISKTLVAGIQKARGFVDDSMQAPSDSGNYGRSIDHQLMVAIDCCGKEVVVIVHST